ncbi:DUF6932 family protein [Microbacterium sp. MM2322]|uniref:DUF6932 family protein n=1 Tax=Microbacterium sp. MM2322 TaxID=3157631 RepID=UPI0032D5A968
MPEFATVPGRASAILGHVEDGMDWATVLDDRTGWLLPGVHEVEMEDVYREFAADGGSDRRTAWLALEQLLTHLKELFPSGRLLLAGTFVSRQGGPCEALEVAIIPDEPSAMEHWSDNEEHRFQLCMSLHDVIVASLGPEYFEVLHPFGGRMESYFVVPKDADQVVMWMGTVTLPTGDDVPGYRGVVEVVW